MIRFALAAVGLISTSTAAFAQSPIRGPAEFERMAAECTNAQNEHPPATVQLACTRIIRADFSASGARAFAYRQRGIVYFEQGDQTRALDDFNSAIQYNPHFAEGFITRAAFYEARGDYALAVADYDQVIRIHPELGIAYNARCWLRTLSGSDLDQARVDCDRAIELGVGANAYDTRGVLNLKQGRFEAALADFAASVEAGRSAHSLYGRGLAALRLGQIETGQADIASAMAADPQLSEAYRRYGLQP